MRNIKVLAVLLSIFLFSSAGNAFADDKSTVQAFYDFLSNPASESAAETFKAATDENWQSIGDYSGKNKKRDEFIGQVSVFFAKKIPDLNWQVQEMIQEDNKVVVRSRATGTPQGSFFGVDGQGKSFDILTIDIHTLENGKIVSSHHVEDWAAALQQLSGK